MAGPFFVGAGKAGGGWGWRRGRGRVNRSWHFKRSRRGVFFGACVPNGFSKKESNEVRAVLRRLVIQKAFTQDEIDRAYNLAGAMVGMLTAAMITLGKGHDDK